MDFTILTLNVSSNATSIGNTFSFLISKLQSWRIYLTSCLLIICIKVRNTETRPAFWPCFSLLTQSSFQFIDFCIPGVRRCFFDHLLLCSEECGCIFPFFRATSEQHFREVVQVAYWYVWARLVIKYFGMGSGHKLKTMFHGSLYSAWFPKHCILMCDLRSLIYVFFLAQIHCPFHRQLVKWEFQFPR